LNGLLVAVRLAEDTLSAQTQYSAVRIFSDSQSALGVIRHGRQNDAQRWVKEMVQRVDSKPITFHWLQATRSKKCISSPREQAEKARRERQASPLGRWQS